MIEVEHAVLERAVLATFTYEIWYLERITDWFINLFVSLHLDSSVQHLLRWENFVLNLSFCVLQELLRVVNRIGQYSLAVLPDRIFGLLVGFGQLVLILGIRKIEAFLDQREHVICVRVHILEDIIDNASHLNKSTLDIDTMVGVCQCRR